jgi:hypothetical protein
MAQKQSYPELMETLPFANLMSPELATVGKKRVQDFIKMQVWLFEDVQKANQEWSNRVQAEMHLGTQLACRFAAARSVPEAMAAYEEWIRCWCTLATEDVKHAFAETQKLMERGAHYLNGNGHVSRVSYQ